MDLEPHTKLAHKGIETIRFHAICTVNTGVKKVGYKGESYQTNVVSLKGERYDPFSCL